MHRAIPFGLAALALCLPAPPGVQASSVLLGDLHLDNLGAPVTADTGNIDTARTFQLGILRTSGGSGVFSDFPSVTFGPQSFDVTSGLFLYERLFGRFSTTRIVGLPSTTGFRNFEVLGIWFPSMQFGDLYGRPIPSEALLRFQQTPPTNGDITFSGLIRAVPEPSSIVMGLTGLAAGVGIYRLRRWRRHLAVA